MKKRRLFLFVLLTVIMLVSAVLYLAGRLGFMSERLSMLLLLPLMLGIVVLCCMLYVEVVINGQDNA